MFECKRRSLVRALGALPLMAAVSRATTAESFQSKAIREVDISAYDSVLLPREHGQLIKISGVIRRRYPSREHSMQMAAFFNSKDGLLVIANDPLGGIADWEVRPGKLRIYFYGEVPDIQVVRIEPTVKAAAERYKEWAIKQTWVTERARASKKLNFIAVASSSMEMEKIHLKALSQSIASPIGVWFTLWRRYAFDRMYPDYKAKEPIEFSRLLARLNEQGAISFPYINGLLWDENLEAFKERAPKLALRSETSSTIPYSDEMSFLRYACPHSTIWQDTLVSARNSIVDSNGNISSGVYVDMVAATDPMPCWSSEHGHKPGDPYAWQNGVRSILGRMSGVRMVEGCAEIYLDLMDYALMHFHTDKDDIVPLWTSVYGDIVAAVGWKMPMSVTAVQYKRIEERVKSCQVGGMGSPWMTVEHESLLLNRGFLNDPPQPPIPHLFK